MLKLLIFTSVFFVSCQKDDTHKKEPRALFSVDLDSKKFDLTNNIEGYIAAYTPDGELINYGNLSDSVKWELKADYKQDFIDIVYFEISHKTSLHIDHYKNVPIGQSFTDPNKIASGAFINQAIKITFKVEDFGNRDGNSTSSTPYESRPYKHNRGNSYAYGEFLWDNMKDGYTYKSAYIDASLDSQGT